MERNRSSKHIVDELRKLVRQRIDKGNLAKPGDAPVKPEPEEAPVVVSKEDPMVRRVKQDIENGVLDEVFLRHQLDKRDLEYVKCSLVELSGLPSKTVNQMLGTKTPKAMVAVAWKAGLTMGMAERLQRDMLEIPRDKVMRAAAGGGYPLSEPDLDWYVESFSV